MKTKIIFFFYLLFVINLILRSAEAQNLFGRSFRGPSYGEDIRDVKQTTDGGYIVTGSIFNTSSLIDVILLKLNPYGTIQWYKVLGSTSSDIGKSVIQSFDGSYLVVGTLGRSDNSGENFYVIKTNSVGDTLWTKTFGGIYADGAHKILQTNGGYIIAGFTNNSSSQNKDVCIIKITSNGDTLWSKIYYGLYDENAYDINATDDGAFIVTGYIQTNTSISDTDILLMKIDSSGNLMWAKNYSLPGSHEFCNSVYQTDDHGYIMCGKTNIVGNNPHAYLIKTDNSGNLIWSKTFGGNYSDYGFKVIPLSDGGYMMCGEHRYSPQTGSGFLIRLNSIGDTLFTRIYSSAGDSLGMLGAYTFVKTMDNGYILAGHLHMNIIKTDSLGRTCRDYASGITVHTPITNVNTLSLNEESVVTQIGRGSILYLVNLTSEGCSTIVGVNQISNIIPNSFKLFQNYPNPFNPKTIINYELPVKSAVLLKVYDALGKKVITLVNQKQSAGSYNVEFEGNNLPSGVYFYKLVANNFAQTSKMILLR